jgi:hypothetical protein
VRRLVPWALLGLLVVGVAVGAGLGQSQAPSGPAPAAPGPGSAAVSAAAWVRDLLATTARAGSARFSYVQVTDSPNPLLRNTTAGRGAVDFAKGAVQVAEVERQGVTSPSVLLLPHLTQPAQNALEPARQGAAPLHNVLETIAIGKTVYQDLGYHWIKLALPRDPHFTLGLQLAANASVALSGIEGTEPVASLRRLGPAWVNGVATTRYLVTDTTLQPCAHTAIPASAETQGPTTVWVDREGRLVQARFTLSTSGYLPPSARALPGFATLPRGATTTTAMLTFSHFGAPVTIVAPRLTPLQGGSSASFAITARACTGKARG